MKVYVISVCSWNGTDDELSVYGVKSSEEDASEFCQSMNATRRSPYSPEYVYEEYMVDEC